MTRERGRIHREQFAPWAGSAQIVGAFQWFCHSPEMACRVFEHRGLAVAGRTDAALETTTVWMSSCTSRPWTGIELGRLVQGASRPSNGCGGTPRDRAPLGDYSGGQSRPGPRRPTGGRPAKQRDCHTSATAAVYPSGYQCFRRRTVSLGVPAVPGCSIPRNRHLFAKRCPSVASELHRANFERKCGKSADVERADQRRGASAAPDSGVRSAASLARALGAHVGGARGARGKRAIVRRSRAMAAGLRLPPSLPAQPRAPRRRRRQRRDR